MRIILIAFFILINSSFIKPDILLKDENKDYSVSQSYSEKIFNVSNLIYQKWKHKSRTRRVIIIDFSKPMEEDRLFVVDLDSGKIIKSSRVCHGYGSGTTPIPTKFSNVNNSKTSSKGVMVTSEIYQGRWGYSMRVEGLQPGINSNVRKRAIVFHTSDVQRRFFSLGCFSIPGKDYKKVIDMTKNGSLIFVFSCKEDIEKNTR
jgi:hypothetical protein